MEDINDITIDTEKKRELLDILRKIESENNGLIKPEYVVAEARSRRSPLHDYFDWDNDHAAEQWRLQQARQLISTVRVEMQKRNMRGFYHVRVETSDGGYEKGYVSVEKVISNQDLFLQKKRELLERIEYWQTEAENFDDLQGIVNTKKLMKAKKQIGSTRKVKSVRSAV